MRIQLPPLHASQTAIAKSTKRFRVAACGRRFGKGILGLGLCFETALSFGRHAWWVAPSFASASCQAAWSIARNVSSKIPGCDVSLKHYRIAFPDGGWMQIKSAEEPDSLRGEGVDLGVIDEAAHLPKLEEAWEQCLRPALSDRAGKALFISTPRGFNYFHKLYRRAETDCDWASFHYVSKDRPTFDPAEYSAAKRELPGLVFRQEYDAEFVQLAGALFKREHFRFCDAPPATKRDVRAWDLAWTTKTKSDYTVGVRAGLTNDGTLVVKSIVRGRWEWPEAVRIVSETAKADGRECVQSIETVGAQAGFEQTLRSDPTLANIGIFPQRVTTDKITRALPVLSRAESGRVLLVRAPWNNDLVDEFCTFPEGEHDDIVDATSACVEMIANTKPIAFGGMV